jgi:hypothetical protein
MRRACRNSIYSLIFLSVLFIFFSGCRKEKSYWNDDFIAPLAHGGLTLANLFPDTTIKTNSDSTLKIAFEANLINYQLDSLLKIPDTAITTAFTFTLNLPHPPSLTAGTNIPVNTNTITANYYALPNGIQLRKAVINQGKITFSMKNTVYEPLRYHYQLLSATKNNRVLDTMFHIPPADSASGVPGILNGVINLSGYSIDFTGINHNTFNTTAEIDSIIVDDNASPGHLYYNQGVYSTFTFQGLIPQYAVGYFGNQSINVGPDTTSFSFANNIKSGILNLNSASAILKIINEFGVDMHSSINYISAISTANQQTVTINSGPLVAPININSAFNNGPNNPVTPSTKTVTLNSSNTPQLTNFIGILPNKIGYKLSAQINPGTNGNQSGSNDFGYYGTAFKAFLDIDIPLFFSASNILLTDTQQLDLSGISQLNNINRGELTLTATNGYPFSISLQGYLLDAYHQQIDVLFNSPNVIQEPPLDANLKVISPVKSKLFIPLNPTKIANLKRAKYISYVATFNTASQPNQVKFYNYYNLDILLTADINYSVGK